MNSKKLNPRIWMMLLLLCALGSMFPALAQQTRTRTITGLVTDEAKEPLIGASVVVKGTTVGTITDFDGNFVLSVPTGAIALEFSYVGYKSKNNHCSCHNEGGQRSVE